MTDMDSRDSFASQESTKQTDKMGRKRPMLTCAVSLFVIAHQACTVVQGIHGPLGTAAKLVTKFATFASPIAILLRYQGIILVLLSFLDYLILAVVNEIEKLYPPSGIVFNKIDDLLQVAEALPDKINQAMHKVKSSDRSSRSDLVFDWEMSKGAKEKEIKVDGAKGAVMKDGSYKEVLTKGKRERGEGKKEDKKKKKKETKTKGKKSKKNEVKPGDAIAADANNGGDSQEEILDLFETAWLKK